MQIKAADDKQSQIAALTELAGRHDVETATRRRIEQEIWNVRTGVKGEQDAAYEIEFHFGKSEHVMTIHDLRIECDGRVAQIDHLILNRFLQIWMCESKAFGEGVAINEHGEWSAYYGGRARGIPSPVEQNKRHAVVLNDVFDKGLVTLPKRLGMTLRPDIRNVVLVSNRARITRPKGRTLSRAIGLVHVIKVEQLLTTIQRYLTEMSDPAFALTAVKLVGRETVERLARQLAALHAPASVDWAARFGISGPQISRGTRHGASTGQSPELRRPIAISAVCVICGKGVTAAVAAYCRSNESMFGGRILCFSCQRDARTPGSRA